MKIPKTWKQTISPRLQKDVTLSRLKPEAETTRPPNDQADDVNWEKVYQRVVAEIKRAP